MKKRQRRIAALLLACAVASVPVSQAFAETTYDVAAGVDAQILFPKDCLTNIAGAVTVDGAEAAADENGSWTNADDAKSILRDSFRGWHTPDHSGWVCAGCGARYFKERR